MVLNISTKVEWYPTSALNLSSDIIENDPLTIFPGRDGGPSGLLLPAIAINNLILK